MKLRGARSSWHDGNVRLGLIGDVHAEDELLGATLAFFRNERVDHVLCTGDVVDGVGDVDRTCALLREAGAFVVRGNHDRWIRTDELRSLPHAHRMTDLAVPTIAFLKNLPSTKSLDLPTGGTLLLCHGVGENDMQGLRAEDRGVALSSNDDLLAVLFDPNVRVLIAGHTRRCFADSNEEAESPRSMRSTRGPSRGIAIRALPCSICKPAPPTSADSARAEPSKRRHPRCFRAPVVIARARRVRLGFTPRPKYAVDRGRRARLPAFP
jgi:predicted phosphodiesterase